jgi:hypothetical protein
MLIFQQPRQPFEGALEGLPQAATLGSNPVVIEAGEQIASIEGDGPLQSRPLFSRVAGVVGPRERFLELGDVQLEGGRVAPAERPAIDVEEAIRFRKRVSKAVEEISQVGQSLLLRGIWPEEEGQAMAGRGAFAVEEEVGQQGLEAGGIDSGQRLSSAEEPKAAQQFNSEHRLRSFVIHLQLPHWCRISLTGYINPTRVVN